MNGNEGIERKVKNLKQRNANIEKINNKFISKPKNSNIFSFFSIIIKITARVIIRLKNIFACNLFLTICTVTPAITKFDI